MYASNGAVAGPPAQRHHLVFRHSLYTVATVVSTAAPLPPHAVVQPIPPPAQPPPPPPVNPINNPANATKHRQRQRLRYLPTPHLSSRHSLRRRHRSALVATVDVVDDVSSTTSTSTTTTTMSGRPVQPTMVPPTMVPPDATNCTCTPVKLSPRLPDMSSRWCLPSPPAMRTSPWRAWRPTPRRRQRRTDPHSHPSQGHPAETPRHQRQSLRQSATRSAAQSHSHLPLHSSATASPSSSVCNDDGLASAPLAPSSTTMKVAPLARAGGLQGDAKVVGGREYEGRGDVGATADVQSIKGLSHRRSSPFSTRSGLVTTMTKMPSATSSMTKTATTATLSPVSDHKSEASEPSEQSAPPSPAQALLHMHVPEGATGAGSTRTNEGCDGGEASASEHHEEFSDIALSDAGDGSARCGADVMASLAAFGEEMDEDGARGLDDLFDDDAPNDHDDDYDGGDWGDGMEDQNEDTNAGFTAWACTEDQAFLSGLPLLPVEAPVRPDTAVFRVEQDVVDEWRSDALEHNARVGGGFCGNGMDIRALVGDFGRRRNDGWAVMSHS